MQKPNYVQKIEIIGIHNRFDIYQEFKSGINIIYGLNGVGKTTLIHVLTNILNGDYYRFFDINFYRIKVWFNNDNVIKVYRNIENASEIKVCANDDRRGKIIYKNENKQEENQKDDDEDSLAKYTDRENIVLPSAYFPAFRNMIEAWKSIEDSTDIDNTTSFARKVFGDFTPELNYPSIKDVQKNLVREIEVIGEKIKNYDRSTIAQLSINFLTKVNEAKGNKKPIKSITNKIKTIYKEIENFPISPKCYLSSTEVYNNILEMLDSGKLNTESTIFLDIYSQALERILNLATEEFLKIDKFLSAVNKFLDGKEIKIVKPNILDYSSSITVQFEDNSSVARLDVLSSGERHILTIIYTATYISQKKVVLIDEPEISLHIDWQRKLISRISEQLSEVQIIACTHSPMITADHSRQELQLKLTDSNMWGVDEKDEDHILWGDKNKDLENFDEYDFVTDDEIDD